MSLTDMTDTRHPDLLTDQPEATRRRSSLWLGILPLLGPILFVINAVPILRDRTGDWKHDLFVAGVYYMVGWAGIGAAVAHVIFSRHTSASIGWAPSPFEREIGFANLGFGVVGLLAASQDVKFALAIVLASSIFRVGCGIGHIHEIVANRNYSVNNTLVLVANFAVPAALLGMYYGWIA